MTLGMFIWIAWTALATIVAIYSTFVLCQVSAYCLRMSKRLDITDPRERAYFDVYQVIALDGVCSDAIPDPETCPHGNENEFE